MGKGNKKVKGKKVGLGEFMGETATNVVTVDGKAVELPNGPRASTLEIDITKLPRRPPYTATVANLAYDVTEKDLENFFEDVEIERVEIPRQGEDSGDKRFKGIAYVIVDGPNAVDNLAQVLAKSDFMLLNRKVKIDIYQPDSRFGGDRRGGDRMGRGGPGERDDPGFGRSDNNDDWRGGGAPAEDRSSSSRGFGGSSFGERREPERGYGSRDTDRGYGSRDYGASRDFGSSRGYDRDSRDSRDDRGGAGGDRDDRDRGYGGSRDSYGPPRSAADDDNQWRRAAPEIPVRTDIRDEPRRDEPRRDEPRRDNYERRDEPARTERPRLQLQKRTTEKADSGASAPSSIFGAAKPIDTRQKEKEIEEKLKKVSLRDENPRRDYDRRDGPRRDDPRDGPRRDDPRDGPRQPELTTEERARQKEEELKKRVELGIVDSRPECDREDTVTVTSRFAALNDDDE